jgi:uncharacterized protein (TIGR02246 family)
MRDQTEAASEVRQLIESWAQAVRDRDLDAILAHHGSDFVMYDVPPPFQLSGLDAYRKTWPPFFENSKAGVFDIQELHVTADENVAFCFAAMRCEDKVGNAYVPLDFRLTIGLKKINDQWTIMHEHHSVPSE